MASKYERIWYDPEGIRVSTGRTVQKRYTTLVTWEQAAKRIRELLDLGRYMPQGELDRVQDFERLELAKSLIYARREFSDEARDAGYLPLTTLTYSDKGGFPEIEKQMQHLLEDHDTLSQLVDEWTLFAAVYEKDRSLLRSRWCDPAALLGRLEDLQREPHIFTTADGYDPQRRFFISDDEIDRILRGSERNYESRLDTFSFFSRNTDAKERERFLKQQHGEYSGYHGGNDNQTYTSAGLSFSHGSLGAPYAQVELKWPAVTKRVSNMISLGRFLYPSDAERMADYEVRQLAKLVMNFFRDATDEYARPTENILVATKKDFETKNRKKFCARIATGDYDAIIIGHSQFEKIPMSKERQEIILRRQIDSILDGIREAKRNHAENYSIKQMERTRKSLENRLAKLNDQSRKDDVVTFEQLGVDRIFVDESHYFKNLFLATKMRNVGGISQTEAQKSSDLFMKCQYLDEITGGRGVVFATGTPISNSMVELYTIQRYLQYSTLEVMGLLNFDDWAANYGETVTAIELSPEGSGYRSKTRFAKFYNLPELMSTFKMVADIQTADMLMLPVPKANFHTEVIKPSPMQEDMIKSLADRAEEIRAGHVDPSVDNMLRITNDGRKLALDMRLINPLAPDSDTSKTSICARNVYSIWERTREQKSAQLVFCDLSTPKGDGSFNFYDDLKAKLVAKGIPAEEIAYIHEANTEVRKKELFSKVRSGQVRVLIGSTAKMGAGTNCQDKLIALHDADCPWRPSDLAQRLGRIVRQGNQNPEVEIFRYVTENTFDAYLYQLVENKQKFIAQIMTSKAPARIADDVDETALSYSEIKALATGNPLIIEKCNLDVEVSKLNMLKANHLNQRFALENLVLRKYPADITKLTEAIAGYEKDVATAQAHPKPAEGFIGMEIKGTHYSEKEAAGRAVINACTELQGSEPVPLGQYRGFSMSLQYDAAHTDYKLTMKGAMSHTISLGADIFGNITRMDNLVDGMAKELAEYQAELQDTRTQLANAKAEMETPFAKEAELAEKSARLKELNILLNMDQKDKTLMDDAPEEESPDKEKSRSVER